MQNRTHYTSLPHDVLVNILSFLVLEDIAVMSRINTFSSHAAHDTLLWQMKFLLHFPNHINKIQNRPNIDWYKAFRNVYYDPPVR